MFQSLPGPAGSLQVLVEEPDLPPAALAVICHPHPLHGGSLTNKVVHQLARTFLQQGAVCVRFNFRGVGESEGAFDNGHGELADLLAVVDWARQNWPQLELWLGGFSFGGLMAIQGAISLRPKRLITVAPAISYLPPDTTLDLSGLDWLLVQGEDDEVVSSGSIVRWVESLASGPKLAMVAGTGHFFHGRLNDLKQVILETWPDG